MRIDKHNMRLILVLLVLVISVGYAIIQSDLNINGVAQIRGANWNIHWENVQVAEGSVTANTPVIDTAMTTVSYTVTLSEPGDFYEFTVDAANDGTLDGMIESIISKLNNTEITNIPDYLNYSATYEDGTNLAEKQILAAGDTETYKIRIGYRRDITAEELPSTNQTLNLTFSITYRQADDTAVSVPHNSLYHILQQEAVSGGLAREYEGPHQDSMAGRGHNPIYHYYAETEEEATSVKNKNNIIFGGFCWQMWRTTDTGGVKVIYNGVPSEGKCNNTGANTTIGSSVFNEGNTTNLSQGKMGYMYNPDTLATISVNVTSSGISNHLFGESVTYSDGSYTLTNTQTGYDSNHKYVCTGASNNITTCSSVRYYFTLSGNTGMAMTLNTGKTIIETLEDMLSADNVNQTDSVIKTMIDTWYENNLESYGDKLEDTIFCNGRNLKKTSFNNAANGLSCPNETDKFSVSNPKAQLTYKIGLMTRQEVDLLKTDSAAKSGAVYWLITPRNPVGGTSGYVSNYYVAAGSLNLTGGSYNTSRGVRPAISLKNSVEYTSGNGSTDSPYIVE